MAKQTETGTVQVEISQTDRALVTALASGDTISEIAKARKTKQSTVSLELLRLRAKVSAKNAPHLVAIFIRQNWIN